MSDFIADHDNIDALKARVLVMEVLPNFTDSMEISLYLHLTGSVCIFFHR